MTTILIAVDEDLLRWSLGQRFREAGYDIVEATTGAETLERMGPDVDVVLLDARLPDAHGLDVLERIRRGQADALVLVMSASATTAGAVLAMRSGAADFLEKPFDLDEGFLRVERALETTRLRREMRDLRAAQASPWGFERLIGTSPVMIAVRDLLRRVAESPASTVLLTGESGTGKDLAAKCVHYNSSRWAGPFMNITCSAIAESLIESELFGHEAGAFTDARRQKKGLLELAHGGTVFLDEIGEMAPGTQAKVLRFLEDKTFKRVGGAADVSPDVRIIAATNRDLARATEAGSFRQDLYYRLNVVPVHMPPLRERAGDIEILARHLIDDFNREFKKSVQSMTADALERLERYGWPGNVRELRNVLERAMLLTNGVVLEPRDFTFSPMAEVHVGFTLPLGGIDFEALEKDLVSQALEREDGNQTRAALLLGMNRDQIRYRIEKFALSLPAAATRARH